MTYLPTFITNEVASELISNIDKEQWLSDISRRVQHYGYKYDYRIRSINQSMKVKPIPTWLNAMCEKLVSDGLFSKLPDQVIINEYLAGQGIANHIDCEPCFMDTIASLSLGSTCVMDFTNKTDYTKCQYLLEPKSLLLLSGVARYNWLHGIAKLKTDNYHGQIINRSRRISITFRNVILN